jgi:hypothetical protein
MGAEKINEHETNHPNRTNKKNNKNNKRNYDNHDNHIKPSFLSNKISFSNKKMIYFV